MTAILVRGVEDGSPAEAAGIAEGDLLVAAAGRPIADVDALHEVLRDAGFPLELTLVRGAEERVVTVPGPSRKGSSREAGSVLHAWRVTPRIRRSKVETGPRGPVSLVSVAEPPRIRDIALGSGSTRPGWPARANSRRVTPHRRGPSGRPGRRHPAAGPRASTLRSTTRAAGWRASPGVQPEIRPAPRPITAPRVPSRPRRTTEETHARELAPHHGPAARPPQLGRAVEDQDGRAAQDDHPRAAGRGAGGGRLQHVPAAVGRRLHRPPDGLRHVRHERPAVGRDDAGRRGLRRQPELLPPRGGDPALLRLPLHRPDPPGPRRGAPDQPDADQARRPHPRATCTSRPRASTRSWPGPRSTT